jgi:hypothetical protein
LINGTVIPGGRINFPENDKMKKRFLIFLCLLVVVPATATTDFDSIPANPKDVESPAAIIAAVYDVISGPAGEKRNWDRMRTLFLPEARMIATRRRDDGTATKRVLSVEEYIQLSGPLLEKDGFFERELGRKTESYGNIVHVFSTYDSKRKKEDDKPFARGINSFQLWNDGKRWWVVTILWLSETSDNPIPEKYLE